MSDFVIQNRDQQFEIKVKLYNPSGYEYDAATLMVEAVCIEESLHNFYVKGYIVISMRFETLEKGDYRVIRRGARRNQKLRQKFFCI